MKAVIAATAIGLMAAPVFAGTLDPAPIEPAPVVAPIAPVPAPSNWQGLYAGAQAGYGWFDDDIEDGDDWLGGVHVGWLGQAAGFVYGFEGDYNYSEMDLAGGELDSLSHLKAKAGYEMGRALIYATGGGAYADIDDVGNDWGWTAGAGVDFLVTESVSVGAEALYHWFNDFDDQDVDIEGTTVAAKVSYHF